jgi:thioredoxin reductase (NADPH)
MVPEDVTKLDLTGDIKEIETASGVHEFDAVILATGAAHKPLGVPDEERLTGFGVSSCATCDGAFYRDMQVAVVGGGDSAFEEALFLTRFATSVTLIHRRGEFRGSKIMEARVLAHPKINIRWNSEVTGLIGDNQLEAITIHDRTDGHSDQLLVGGLFVAIGHKPNSELVRGQIPLDDDGYVIVDHPTTATPVAGVFASGDLVDRRYRQAITASGSGCAAALDAEHYLSELRHSATSDDREGGLGDDSAPMTRTEATTPMITAGLADDASLDDMVETSMIPVLVDFWADNCAPCRLMHPVLDDIAQRYPGRLKVVKINIDGNPQAAQNYAIRTAPTMKLFVDGAVVRTIVGAKPTSKLVAELETFL